MAQTMAPWSAAPWSAATPWNAPAAPMVTVGAPYGVSRIAPLNQVMAPPAAVRGPLARLVRNRDASGGLPAFALTDQAGVIQRYVEPVPGVDLDSHIGSVVVVRHDTGRTLLASQLELPAVPLEKSTNGEEPAAGSTPPRRANRSSRNVGEVRRAQFVDDDDSTVELLNEAESAEPSPAGDDLSPDADDQSEATIEAIPEDASFDGSQGSEYDGQLWEELPPGDGPSFGQPFYGPTHGGDVIMDCPQCYGQSECYCPQCQGAPLAGEGMLGGADGLLGLRNRRSAVRHIQCFADVQFNFLRLHLMEGLAGKLSESYQLSPRFVLGFEGGEITDGRVRYWAYERDTELLRGERIRFEMDVLDIEATQRFQIKRSDIVVGAGLRLAAINAEDVNEDEIGADLIGMTVAADAHTHICNLPEGRLAWVFGGRLSLLGGDWGGDEDNNFIDVPMRDDNVVTDELFGGIEYSFRYRRVDLRARLAFEMQNWHSDVFAQQAGTDSIGFLGPGVHLGAQF